MSFLTRFWNRTRKESAESRPKVGSPESKGGKELLARAQSEPGLSERETLALEAAHELERSGDYVRAASAWELIDNEEEVVRCLKLSGDLERLEGYLEQLHARDQKVRRVQTLLRDFDAFYESGERARASLALREVRSLDPSNVAIAELEQVGARKTHRPGLLDLQLPSGKIRIVGKMPVVLGRGDADVAFRGASVSRAHAELDLEESGFSIRDLASRNGTFVASTLATQKIVVRGETEISLGEDSSALISREGNLIRILGTKGLDRGMLALASTDPIRLPGIRGAIRYEGGQASFVSDGSVAFALNGKNLVVPVELVLGDILEVAGARFEVIG